MSGDYEQMIDAVADAVIEMLRSEGYDPTPYTFPAARVHPNPALEAARVRDLAARMAVLGHDPTPPAASGGRLRTEAQRVRARVLTEAQKERKRELERARKARIEAAAQQARDRALAYYRANKDEINARRRAARARLAERQEERA